MTVERLRAVLAEQGSELGALVPVNGPDSTRAEARVELEALSDTLLQLRRAGFERLEMITAVDRSDRFELIYLVASRPLTLQLTLRVEVPREEPVVPSAVAVWPAANWQEREVYDLFGIRFSGHPDLRRILLPEDWMGFPLRKDYVDERIVKRPDYI